MDEQQRRGFVVSAAVDLVVEPYPHLVRHLILLANKDCITEPGRPPSSPDWGEDLAAVAHAQAAVRLGAWSARSTGRCQPVVVQLVVEWRRAPACR
jgi:hypothetical protein